MEKKFLVSFLLAVSVLFLIATVSAAGPLASITKVEVDGVNVNANPAVVVGDILTVRVDFNSLVNASDITVQVELEGNKKNVQVETRAFDVETGSEYSKSLKLDVPFDLKDTLSGDVTLTVKVSGNGYKTENSYILTVQRSSFDASIKSISVPQNVKAGEIFPVDVVLKNLGYNNLNDLYVTASIPALSIEKTAFLGDLVALECSKDDTAIENYGVNVTRKCNEDNQATISGRVFLQLPWDTKAGIYALELTVKNEDTTSSETIQVAVENAFSSGNFIVSGNQLLIVNPTNEVVVYRIVPESTGAVTVSVSDSLVAVPAGSSKTVKVDASANVAGTQSYAVNIFSADGNLLDRVSFTATSNGSSASPIVVLTVILAIIFIVLLVVLIVLIGKKPEKSEEFGESYY